MPVVGFHQARRPRQTAGARLRRELSWPRPGGVVLALAGAAVVIGGAFSLDATPGTDAAGSAAAPFVASTTPDTSRTPIPPTAVATTGADPASPPASAAPAAAAPAGAATASPLSPQATASPLLVAGALASSPIQELFAADPAGDASLRNVFNAASPLVLVNKHNALNPANFAPSDLRSPAIAVGSGENALLRAEAAGAAERMFAAAAADGVGITVLSSYRSYEIQVGVYNGHVAAKGVAGADTTSARPGYSEHQTGLALDIGDANAGHGCDFTSCFAGTAAAQWVAAHGAKYGFIVRYVPGSEAFTGYLAEPWHLRYVGVAVAQDMDMRGARSYEEYLGLPAAPGYK